MMRSRGFTLMELLISIAVIGVLLTAVGFAVRDRFLNSRGATEERAKSGVYNYIKGNGLAVSRISCAGDSDEDGYGTCTLILENDVRIGLKCPLDYFDVEWFGASSCKEVFTDIQVGGGGGRMSKQVPTL